MNAANPLPSSASSAEKRSYEPSMEEILASIRRIIADDQSLPRAGRDLVDGSAAHLDRPIQPSTPPELARASVQDVEARPIARETPVAGLAHGPVAAPQFASPDPTNDASATGESHAGPTVIHAIPPQHDPVPSAHLVEPEVGVTDEDVDAAAFAPEPARDENLVAEIRTAEPFVETPYVSPPWTEEPRHEEEAAADQIDLEANDDETADASVASDPERPPAMSPLFSAATDSSVASAFNMLAATRLADNSDELLGLAREMIRPLLRDWLDENLPSMVERLVRAEIERVARGGR